MGTVEDLRRNIDQSQKRSCMSGCKLAGLLCAIQACGASRQRESYP